MEFKENPQGDLPMRYDFARGHPGARKKKEETNPGTQKYAVDGLYGLMAEIQDAYENPVYPGLDGNDFYNFLHWFSSPSIFDEDLGDIGSLDDVISRMKKEIRIEPSGQEGHKLVSLYNRNTKERYAVIGHTCGKAPNKIFLQSPLFEDHGSGESTGGFYCHYCEFNSLDRLRQTIDL